MINVKGKSFYLLVKVTLQFLGEKLVHGIWHAAPLRVGQVGSDILAVATPGISLLIELVKKTTVHF